MKETLVFLHMSDKKLCCSYKTNHMIKIEVKEGENIERALKRYKRKHRNVQVMQNIRERQHYTKKSVLRRRIVQKAAYIQHLRDQEEF